MLIRALSRQCLVGFSVLAIAAFASPIARAVELSDNLAKVTSGAESATTTRWLSAAFNTDASETNELSSITLLLANPSAGTAALDLYSDGELEPGALIATLTSPASYSTTLEATTFDAGGLALEPSKTYWVVLRVLSGAFDWAWTADNTGSGAGFDPTWDVSEDGGASWYTCDVYPVQLKVTVNETSQQTFIRGDADSSGDVDITDSVGIFGFLFLGDPAALACKESADSNNDGAIDITDGIYLLEWLFLGGLEPPAPGPGKQGPGKGSCGVDPDPAGSPGDLGCDVFAPCI